MDLTDQRYGKLVVMEQGPIKKSGVTWKCMCDCGNTTVVYASNLRSGATQSCQCTQNIGIYKGTHKKSGTRVYRIYYRIRKKGICKEWLGVHGFETFLTDIGEAPSKEHRFVRPNKNIDYSKTNFKWASHDEYYEMYSCNTFIKCFGELLTIKQATKKYNMKRTTVLMRLNAGMSEEDALTKPLRKTRKPLRF